MIFRPMSTVYDTTFTQAVKQYTTAFDPTVIRELSHENLVLRVRNPETGSYARVLVDKIVSHLEERYGPNEFLKPNPSGFEIIRRGRIFLTHVSIVKYPERCFTLDTALERNTKESADKLSEALQPCLARILNGEEIPESEGRALHGAIALYYYHFQIWEDMDKPKIIRRLRINLLAMYKQRSIMDAADAGQMDRMIATINRLRINIKSLAGDEGLLAFDTEFKPDTIKGVAGTNYMEMMKWDILEADIRHDDFDMVLEKLQEFNKEFGSMGHGDALLPAAVTNIRQKNFTALDLRDVILCFVDKIVQHQSPNKAEKVRIQYGTIYKLLTLDDSKDLSNVLIQGLRFVHSTLYEMKHPSRFPETDNLHYTKLWLTPYKSNNVKAMVEDAITDLAVLDNFKLEPDTCPETVILELTFLNKMRAHFQQTAMTASLAFLMEYRLAGGDVPNYEKDFYSCMEWPRLPENISKVLSSPIAVCDNIDKLVDMIKAFPNGTIAASTVLEMTKSHTLCKLVAKKMKVLLLNFVQGKDMDIGFIKFLGPLKDNLFEMMTQAKLLIDVNYSAHAEWYDSLF